jgi:hypothetical protein
MTEHSQKGFMLIESLIAIAILILVSPAFMQYVFTFDINRYLAVISRSHISSVLAIDSAMVEEDSVQQIDIQSKNCDLFFSSILKDGQINISDIAIDSLPMDLIPTTIDVLSENILTTIEFFGKSQYGKHTIFIGANSASTSKPDMFVFSYDPDSHSIFLKDIFYLGPGIVGMDLHPKIYGMHFKSSLIQGVGGENFPNQKSSITKHLGIIEKSIVTPLWIMKYGPGDIISSSSPHLFSPSINLASAYPQIIKMYSDWFMIGTQKSLWSELIIGKVNTEIQNASIIDHVEVGSGVQDIALLQDRVIFASPKNPELDYFLLNQGASEIIKYGSAYTPIWSIDRFDAPGELGNGKSISMHPYGLFLGRTVGNQELYSLIHTQYGQSTFSTTSIEVISADKYWDIHSANPNISIRKSIYVHDGYGVIVLTNSDTDAIKIYAQEKDGGRYQLRELTSIDLPAKPIDFVCVQDQLLVTTESMVTPVINIYEKRL